MLHAIGRRDVEYSQPVGKNLLIGFDQLEPGCRALIADNPATFIKPVKSLSQFVQIIGDVVRHEFVDGAVNDLWVFADFSRQGAFADIKGRGLRAEG